MLFPSLRRSAAAACGVAALVCSANVLAGDDGCRTIALGIMRCDAHSDRTRESVVAQLRSAQAAAPTVGADGCRTIALGIMRCDPNSQLSRESVVGDLRGAQAAGQTNFIGDLWGPAAPQASADSANRAQEWTEVKQAAATHQASHGSF